MDLKSTFPDLYRLMCIRHLTIRDVNKLDKMPKMNCNEQEKKNAKFEILKNIYGEV